ncbi:MAG: hypothetical protein R2909_17935 [Gemmatimonadales bacterium]
MLRIGLEHATTQDVAEQLVSRLIEDGGEGWVVLEGLFLGRHERLGLVVFS